MFAHYYIEILLHDIAPGRLVCKCTVHVLKVGMFQCAIDGCLKCTPVASLLHRPVLYTSLVDEYALPSDIFSLEYGYRRIES